MSESARVAGKPTLVSFEQAAAITDGGLNAIWTYKVADLRQGQRILIYGASGAIGTAGVQLARQRGAEVTAVCNTRNLELVKSLGADRVIDYTREDFTHNGNCYDFVFDAVGKLSFRQCERSLKPGGRYLATDGLHNLLLALWTTRFGDKKVQFAIPPRYTKQDVQYLKGLVERGEFRPVVDRRYAMQQVVEAARYVETEQKVGNVVLIIGGFSGNAAVESADRVATLERPRPYSQSPLVFGSTISPRALVVAHRRGKVLPHRWPEWPPQLLGAAVVETPL
jgi:NADPH:quinone reductase-like Zn-dependent oxidoreductase